MWVLGGYQSDFARNLAREGVGIDGLVREVVEGTLIAAGLPGSEIGVIHVGNAFGQLFTGQGHLGAMPGRCEGGRSAQLLKWTSFRAVARKDVHRSTRRAADDPDLTRHAALHVRRAPPAVREAARRGIRHARPRSQRKQWRPA